jgi:anti-sigma regulatory factor (Ser/Thr protein kinase)
MDIKDFILSQAKQHPTIDMGLLLRTNNRAVSRQYIARLLNEMVANGILVKSGKTKSAHYALPENALWLQQSISLKLTNQNLDESLVMAQVQTQLAGFAQLPENIQRLFNYAFTEMLNNAIEHSESQQIECDIVGDSHSLGFRVRDLGIGVFKKIMEDRQHQTEVESIQDLLKGKTTTDARRHSGEGIFFTSKTADLFLLQSHELRLRVDNTLPDVFIEPMSNFITGTEVSWKINRRSPRLLGDIFKAYQATPDTYEFSQTTVTVKLYTLATDYVSRSQARRLLYGLEPFAKIILDFNQVSTIGQGFADEIFRVFHHRYPHIIIESINANEAVMFMIRHISDKPL